MLYNKFDCELIKLELLNLFWIFFKLGLLTFGGGYAMIPQIKEIVVEKKKWLNEDEMLELIAIAESTPGPIAINTATYIGYKRKGILGSVLATLGVILPSLIIIYLIFLILEQYMQNRYVQFAFTGIKVGVAFLILKAGINLIKKMPKKCFQTTILSVVFTMMIVFELLAISFSSIFLILIGGSLSTIIFSITNRKRVEA